MQDSYPRWVPVRGIDPLWTPALPPLRPFTCGPDRSGFATTYLPQNNQAPAWAVTKDSKKLSCLKSTQNSWPSR